MSESFAAKRSLPPPGQPISEEPEGRATPRIAALMAELIELARERCARCGRILRRPVTVDGIIYGRVCATKVLPRAMTWHTETIPVIGGIVTLPDGRIYRVPPGVQSLVVAVLNR